MNMKFKYKIRGFIVAFLLFMFLMLFLYAINNASTVTESAITNWQNIEKVTKAQGHTWDLGENGEAADLKKYRDILYTDYGYDALLSDHISVNRSIADLRPKDCLDQSYSRILPKAAIIIICYNERLSVLLRTVHSILNRSPETLLHEILIVDDHSSNADLHLTLDEYMQIHFSHKQSKVRLLRMPERRGLMAARMFGARASTIPKDGVFIFLDSHFEAMHGWLPPLLDPIQQFEKTVTCPIIDTIKYDTFKYHTSSNYRGLFKWDFAFVLLPGSQRSCENYEEMVMLGGALAVKVNYFWKLGGFDDGMRFWGGDQYEMSFKVWMCGGRILNVPCSRLGHLYRDPRTKGNTNLYDDYAFLDKNYRRLVDVWLDEKHRKLVLKTRPGMKTADPGDLSERHKIRERLQCKSFTWLLENKLSDNEKIFPLNEPDYLAYGLIRNVGLNQWCLTTQSNSKVLLDLCALDPNSLPEKQKWKYNFRGELRTAIQYCLETNDGRTQLWNCHYSKGNQRWYYNRQNQWIVHSPSNRCLSLDTDEKVIITTVCQKENLMMRWKFSHNNSKILDDWDSILRAQ